LNVKITKFNFRTTAEIFDKITLLLWNLIFRNVILFSKLPNFKRLVSRVKAQKHFFLTVNVKHQLSIDLDLNFSQLLRVHNHLLEIRLLEKSARHDFIIARHHLSNNYFFCQLLENWKLWKIICRTCILSSFTFRQKNINCSNCNWSTKVLKNVNCSTQFIVKKMVYMYSS
jgi:hypothetical protein